MTTDPSPSLRVLLGMLLALALTMPCGCDQAGTPAALQDEPAHARMVAMPVHVAIAGPGMVNETLSIQGRLDVWRREILSAAAAGIIRDVPSLPDQRVQAGELVLLLDPPPGEAEELSKATILRDRAKRTLDRLEHLAVVAPLTVSTSELETQRETFADAESDLDVLRQRQPTRRITAPFTGVRIKVQGSIGDALAEGAKIAELLDVSRYRLRLDVPEASLRLLAVGQNLEVRVLGDDSHATGTVASIPCVIDGEKGTGQVIIDTIHPPATWRPGGSATARLVLCHTTAALVLPRESVLADDGRPYCWVVDRHDGMCVARRSWLAVGAHDEVNVVVTSGLHAGDQIIVDGHGGISDGGRITVVPAASAGATVLPPP